MNLKHPTTNISPHESETPPNSLSTNIIFFPNGKPHHQPLPHTVCAATAVAYRECLKNHAAHIGGHALDGCGEYMSVPTEPSSFKCVACGCHRNFHRREPITTGSHFIDFHRPHRTSTSTSPSPPISPTPQSTNYQYPKLLLSLRTTSDQNQTVATPETPVAIKIGSRKRFRTKFSHDQKEKMLSFAEKVGWKMSRCDDKIVSDFCNEIGIRRGVFKVWMHNNKNTLAKRENDISAITATDTVTTATATAAMNTIVATTLVRSNDSSHQDHGSSSSS